MIKNMYFKQSNKWMPLPNWSRFFVNLGSEFSNIVDNNKKWTLALTLPTKGFIAPLIGVGIMDSIIRRNSKNDIVEDHFRNLTKLDIDTPVLYRKNSRLLRAKFKGVTTYENEPRLLIQTQASIAGGLTEYIQKKDALNIIPSPDQKLKLPKEQKGRKLESDFRLTDAYYGEDSQIIFKNSQTRILFIGDTTLKEDVSTRIFGVMRDDNMISCSLNELLKTKQFQKINEPYQTQYLSSLGRKRKRDMNLTENSIIIYSGSQGYLKWKEKFADFNSIIILDRSEIHFDTAVYEVNNDYIQSKRFEPATLDLHEVPGGVELLLWGGEK